MQPHKNRSERWGVKDVGQEVERRLDEGAGGNLGRKTTRKLCKMLKLKSAARKSFGEQDPIKNPKWVRSKKEQGTRKTTRGRD